MSVSVEGALFSNNSINPPVEDQFMEIINGLQEMNDQLAEEVKSAKNKR